MSLGVLFGIATMVVAALAQGEAVEEKAVRPNFVFFLVDDLGYMDVGANNPDSFYETPNIDRLAATGMRFTNGYAANPVCSPTRYSIMTGKYPSRIGATNYFSGTQTSEPRDLRCDGKLRGPRRRPCSREAGQARAQGQRPALFELGRFSGWSHPGRELEARRAIRRRSRASLQLE